MTRIVSVLFLLAFMAMDASAQQPLTLEDCIQIALQNNATIRVNRNLNASADQDVDASYSGILPSVNMSASTGRYEAGPKEVEDNVLVGFTPAPDSTAIYERKVVTQNGFTTNSNSFGVSLDQNVFDGGEWWEAIGYAKTQKEASDYDLKSVVDNIVLNVQQRFFDVLKERKLLEVNQLAVGRSQDQMNKTQKMFELGAVAKVDVYRSQVNLGNDKIQYLLQKNAVLQAEQNLNLVMGRDPKEKVEISADYIIRPAYDNVENLIQQTLQNNPQLQKNELDKESSDIMVSRSYAVLWPRIGASFSYNRQNEGIERVYTGWDKNWSISYGVRLSLNLFNGFQDKVRIQKSKLAAKNAWENFEQSKRETIAGVVQLVDNYNSYLEIIALNEENLKAAQEEYRLAEERYRIGSGTQLEVRDAQVNLTQAEDTLVRAKYSARVTQAQIETYLGNILEKEKQETN
jgi:outer membrane protein